MAAVNLVNPSGLPTGLRGQCFALVGPLMGHTTRLQQTNNRHTTRALLTCARLLESTACLDGGTPPPSVGSRRGDAGSRGGATCTPAADAARFVSL